MNACELTASVTAAANAIACRMDGDELVLLAVVLVQLGTHWQPSPRREGCAVRRKKHVSLL